MKKKRRKKRGSLLLPIHMPWQKGEASKRSDTQRTRVLKLTSRVPRPRCTKYTKTSPGFDAVWLSPRGVGFTFL
jgi:hypothetical protein